MHWMPGIFFQSIKMCIAWLYIMVENEAISVDRFLSLQNREWNRPSSQFPNINTSQAATSCSLNYSTEQAFRDSIFISDPCYRGLISFYFNSDSHMKIGFIKSFIINICRRKWPVPVYAHPPASNTNLSLLINAPFFLNFWKKNFIELLNDWSTLAFLVLKFLERKRANRFRAAIFNKRIHTKNLIKILWNLGGSDVAKCHYTFRAFAIQY